MAARVAIVAVPLLAVAFFAASLYSSYWQDRAISTFNQDSKPVAQRLPLTLKYLDRAGRFDPGTDTEFLKAVAKVGANDNQAAVETLNKITDQEPDNYRAWALLKSAAERSGDSKLASQAEKKYRQLVPLSE